MSENLKWYRNKDMLKEFLDQNQKQLLKTENESKRNFLKDNINLLQDHLVLLEEKEKLEIEQAKLKAKLYNLESHYELLENFTVPNLRKAIEVIKSKIEFEDLGEMQSGNMYRGYFNDCLDQQEYELIEEVIKNE